MFDGTRPLKRWRYVGIFCEQFMACAAIVHLGPLKQSFWAFYDRDRMELRERTRMVPRRRELVLGPGSLQVQDHGVSLELELAEEGGIEALCPHGQGTVWTHKQAGVAAHGRLTLDGGPPREVRARAVIDDTAGHHSRRTEWHWSAGVGEGSGGVELAWNLVSGVNDPPQGSERAVWARQPAGSQPPAEERPAVAETPPVSFAEDLSSVRCEDGSELRFSAEARRERHDNFGVLASDYVAPFGSFAGTLPGHVELQWGLGVMEHHRARW
jgi:hypothetical protein